MYQAKDEAEVLQFANTTSTCHMDLSSKHVLLNDPHSTPVWAADEVTMCRDQPDMLLTLDIVQPGVLQVCLRSVHLGSTTKSTSDLKATVAAVTWVCEHLFEAGRHLKQVFTIMAVFAHGY